MGSSEEKSSHQQVIKSGSALKLIKLWKTDLLYCRLRTPPPSSVIIHFAVALSQRYMDKDKDNSLLFEKYEITRRQEIYLHRRRAFKNQHKECSRRKIKTVLDDLDLIEPSQHDRIIRKVLSFGRRVNKEKKEFTGMLVTLQVVETFVGDHHFLCEQAKRYDKMRMDEARAQRGGLVLELF